MNTINRRLDALEKRHLPDPPPIVARPFNYRDAIQALKPKGWDNESD